MKEIDEAIQHCLEVAEQEEYSAIMFKQKKDASAFLEKTEAEKAENGCKQCAAEHRQFAEWLTELRELRSLKTDYVFFKAEAKKLLKAAVEDFAHMDFHIYECDGMCDTCPLHGERDHCLKWRHADEALKLIGDSENG